MIDFFGLTDWGTSGKRMIIWDLFKTHVTSHGFLTYLGCAILLSDVARTGMGRMGC